MKTTNTLNGCLIRCGFILNHDQRLTLLQIRESTSQILVTILYLHVPHLILNTWEQIVGVFHSRLEGTGWEHIKINSSQELLLHTREREYLLKVVIRRGFARSPCSPRQLLKGGKHLSKLLHAPQVVPKLPVSRIFRRD